MEPVYARYPFLEGAREAVQAQAPSIEGLVSTGERSAALDRAIERIELAMTGETIGAPHPEPEVEVLSYPLARILVSLVDDRRVLDRYVQAEAQAAIERISADFNREETGPAAIDRDTLFAELAFEIDESDHHRTLGVSSYLEIATDLSEPTWRLVNRPIDAGKVPIEEDEFSTILEAAIRRHIAADLPVAVPKPIEETLEDAVGELTPLVGHQSLPTSFPAPEPAYFPPCMEALLDRVGSEESLSVFGHFAVATFLTSIGVDPDDFEEYIDDTVPPEITRMGERVQGAEGPTQFPPGSCETMVAHDICIRPDELCQQIEHPLEYYAQRCDESNTS